MCCPSQKQSFVVVVLQAGADSPENFMVYDEFDGTTDKFGYRKSWTSHQQDYNPGDPTWNGGKGQEIIGAVNYLSSIGMNAFSFNTMNVRGDDR
eukprot:CAMPEP_0178920658 /NCGR_PEP_ID=MMETSP0786-20121207/15124_1 /TAXON_ID=186022 /ORGANISM="Thalassionema frauenfeldii, Strain CCMP 1798" /LENGTH=93 /DNA_ID=CAMNT_0020594743 /DNA_START=270 /DNA_END=551 /DNA_ORIENTATION=+